MPRNTRLLIILLLLPTLCCAPKPAAKSPVDQRREMVDRLELSTVAMVHWLDGEDEQKPPGTQLATLRAYCAGVWVNENDFVTANHCPENEKYLAVQTRDDAVAGKWRTARLLRARPRVDLAILRVDDVPEHPVARFSQGPIWPGDPLQVVGHIVGQRWTYCTGVVSAFRPNEPDADEDPVDTLQVAGPIWHGDSGGGGFDEFGNLVGIVSYVRANAPFLAYLIHRDVVRDFVMTYAYPAGSK